MELIRYCADAIYNVAWDFAAGQHKQFPNHPILGTIAEVSVGTIGLFSLLFLAAYGG